ncbi:MAG: hypothetical protein V3V31_00060 [Methylococcales bacterium]
MSIFRYLPQCFILALFLAVSGCSKSVTYPQVAWWYDIEFEADQTNIRGLDLNIFGKDWSRAKLLSADDLKGKITQRSLQTFLESDFRFENKMDLNSDSHMEDIVVGVYEKENSAKGKFLAIFKDAVPIAVMEAEGAAGFSALLIHQNRLRWYHCLECGDFETIVWTGTNYFLE